MRVAALDLGSNTSLLMIAEVEQGAIVRELHDETTVTRLGQGVHSARRFHPEALIRMRDCLERYQKIIVEHKCDKVIAVATSAARDVANGEELLKAGRALGIPIHIISEREAELTFRGAICDRERAEGTVVVDVGGGSTEIIYKAGNIIRGTSVDVGSVRLSEMFVKSDPISTVELSQLRAYASEAFAAANIASIPIGEIVAVAGTPTTLAGLVQKIDFDATKIHGFQISLEQIESWTNELATLSLAARSALKGMQPKRADVIVAGATILGAAVRILKQTRVTVSTRGVRYGVALAWQEF